MLIPTEASGQEDPAQSKEDARTSPLMAGQIYSRMKKIASHSTKDAIILLAYFWRRNAF